MMLINGVPCEMLPATDRGLALGDGVFRTLELRQGRPRLWSWQYARLCADARALCLPAVDESTLLEELSLAAETQARSVAKITLTRGSGPRGYAMTEDARPTRIVGAEPWAGYPAALSREGVTLTVCQLRLGLQPRLAGVKHLNRLENVLARSEWHDPSIREGLMLDSEGYAIECTMSNLFMVCAQRVYTPLLDRCGVAGATRAWVMDQLPVTERRLTLEMLLNADEVFLCNSLAGIWPVSCLAHRRWRSFPQAARLAAWLAAAQP